ncbi:ABC transporter ATP-binding protein [Bifidobacterium sp. DSM 109957]|uniref:ABC transporter ATP-binding protein n=1 Tax=Bifidobacterium oedipodis TaxID=2675322 RepID=A0A7Y0ESA6_9BIFI|nr:ABC transporter ATP-binding protein [Bifidobacterium sp. DSM 109957]
MALPCGLSAAEGDVNRFKCGRSVRLPWTLSVRRESSSLGKNRIGYLWSRLSTAADNALPDGAIRELLDAVGCADIELSRPVHDLSGGQAARVSLVRTLLTRPKVLLADEVDAGLDDDNANLVADVLAEAAEHGMAVMRIRHRSPDGRAKRILRLAGGVLSDITEEAVRNGMKNVDDMVTGEVR